MNETKEERLEKILRSVLQQQQSVLLFLQDIFKQELKEGQTHFDLLCERLENETTKI